MKKVIYTLIIISLLVIPIQPSLAQEAEASITVSNITLDFNSPKSGDVTINFTFQATNLKGKELSVSLFCAIESDEWLMREEDNKKFVGAHDKYIARQNYEFWFASITLPYSDLPSGEYTWYPQIIISIRNYTEDGEIDFENLYNQRTGDSITIDKQAG